MASMLAQRDLVITYKRETLLNVGILSKLQPMPYELSRQVFKDNALEKPTQNVFNHLAHYLVSILDPAACSALPWPLYDTKTERTYRNELSALIADYSGKGLVSPVMSSYLVNPGCYKVTLLIFQLSQLAVQRVLVTKMNKEHQKKLYTDMTEQYKTQNEEGFIDGIEKETETMLSKFSNYLRKREVIEKAAEMFRNKIIQMEDILERSKAQEYINKLIDGFIKQHHLPEEQKAEFIKLKNVHTKTQMFENWLNELDNQIRSIETKWDTKMSPFLSMCQNTVRNSEAVVARHTGEADRKSFAIEYNPKTDEICTKELQSLVNSQQKYILKNLVKGEMLSFPNLIRGFLISVCFILKNTEIDANINTFNECLDAGRSNYSEIVEAMKILVEKVMNAESRLSPPAENFNMSVSLRELTVIPPLPDLSDLKMNKPYHPQITYDPFTPLNINKHQFNLRRKVTNNSFTRPLPKMSLVTPFHHNTNRDDFLKSIKSGAFDKQNMSVNLTNISTISHVSKVNETIDCPGFTQQQIFRLLSTKKSTSSKKFKHKTTRPNIHVIKGGLFNESTSSNETFGLYRSHSSPNLTDIKDKLSMAKSRARKLSIMKEGSPNIMEMSGIAVLDRDSNQSTPQGQEHNTSLKCAQKNPISLPTMLVTPNTDSINSVSVASDLSLNGKVDLNKEIEDITLEDNTISTIEPQSIEVNHTEEKCIQNILPKYEGTEDTVILKQNSEIRQIRKLSDTNVNSHKALNNLLKLHKSTGNSQIPRRRTEINHKCSEEISKQHKNTEIIQQEYKITENIKTHKSTENIQFEHTSTDIQKERKSIENTQKQIDEPKIETPQPKQLIKKTSSIEKIINRFKKVRASVLPDMNFTSDDNDFETISEEKENITTVNTVNIDVFTANRVLLPDLLSPSCSILTQKTENYQQCISLDTDSDEEVTRRRPRESLGATLGVDHTFLDQFDLID